MRNDCSQGQDGSGPIKVHQHAKQTQLDEVEYTRERIKSCISGYKSGWVCLLGKPELGGGLSEKSGGIVNYKFTISHYLICPSLYKREEEKYFIHSYWITSGL